MTLDLTIAPADVSSTYRRQVVGYTGPSSYTAGGDLITPNDVRMGKIFAVLGGLITNGSAARLVVYDPVNLKLQIFVPNTGAEATGDLSGYTGRLEFIGQ